MSSTSLAVPSGESSGKGLGLRNKFSIPRVRPRTPSTFSGHSALSNSPHVISNDSPTESEFSGLSMSNSYHSQEFVHPYANPDLVVTPARESTSSLHRGGSGSGNMVRSDSISTITDFSSASSHSTLTHMTSPSSLRQQSLPSPRVSNFTVKEISSPISPVRPSMDKIRDTKTPARPAAVGPAGIPGWMDNPTSPTIQLISLAEAQAQAKERARSATINGGAPPDTLVPFPEADPNPSPTSSTPARSRARSISAGAKNALHNIVGGGGPSPPKLDRGDSDSSLNSHGGSGRSLKHKKSGFMRLFNGKEREMVPPVPTLSDAYMSRNSTSQATVPRTTKMLLPRVPVPPLPTDGLVSNSSSLSSDSGSDFGTTVIQQVQPIPSPKRTPPPLSIITSHSPRPPAANSNLTLPIAGTASKSQEDGRLLCSAPPGTTDFPSLKLRPVSAVFSAHFADHIVVPEVESPLDAEQSLDTPSSFSPSPGRSPLTPGFSIRSEETAADKASIISGISGSGDQSSVIQALQSQIVSAKKAWQRHIWELEGQVRDLKTEIEDLRTAGNEKGFCDVCGRGKPVERDNAEARKVGIVDRPRARTGDAARFGSGN